MWHQGAHGDARSNVAMAQQNNCLACHKEIPEGQMAAPTQTNSTFSQYWVAQGQPTECVNCHVTGYDPKTGTWKADGISCVSCHNPIPTNHPNDTMPVDKNADLCATCHTDARFGWDVWKESVHFQKDMTCTTCHNPHSTSLKLVGDPNPNSDASALCINCHKEVPQNQTHTTHANVDATCITCHVGDSKGNDDFHRVPDHDFKPKLDACNACHANQMHGDGTPPASVSLPAKDDLASAGVSTSKADPLLSVVPAHANPLSFAGLAAVIGLVGGVVWSRRSGKGKK
jgi:predicted CXXCH cytochrome family protein